MTESMEKYLGRSETDARIQKRVREEHTLAMYISMHTFPDEPWTIYSRFKKKQQKEKALEKE